MGDEINNGDVYVSDSGDTWAFDGYFRSTRNAEIREVQAEAKLAADEKERQEFERLKAKYATNA